MEYRNLIRELYFRLLQDNDETECPTSADTSTASMGDLSKDKLKKKKKKFLIL